MIIPEYIIANNHLSLEKFREMDDRVVQNYHLPVELMMENAGLQLARLVVHFIPAGGRVLIGIGPGNNGGGGLVAARRLSGWGFRVSLDIPVKKLNELPRIQLQRALAVSADIHPEETPDIYVDAYLGFSQRLPLSEVFRESVEKANRFKCSKISLDIPTGFHPNTGEIEFKPDAVLTLAAMKTELLLLSADIQLYLADLGIPHSIYEDFGIEHPAEFRNSGLLQCRIPH
jgi:NAD(P)H-hydrate epimerase